FSKRRQQIKSQLNEESTWFEREKIWDKTRAKKKESIPREELQDYWRSEYEAQNVSYPQPSKSVLKDTALHIDNKVSDVREVNPDTLHLAPNTHSPKVNINQAVAEAISHCSERTVAFKPEEIKKFVFSEVGKYSHQDLEQAITNNNELIHLDKQVTTQTALLREIATIRIVKDGKDKVKHLSTFQAMEQAIAGESLTEGQRKAVTLAATTSDQFIAWQGKAGVGKTYALNEFKEIAQREGYTVKGFAPSANAAKVLSEEMGIETTTVARKLVSKPLQEESEQQPIWIVDEAGLLGAKSAFELLKKAKAENARVLLVGDTRQLSSVAAGNPFKSLRTAGIATAYLNQSLRQKTKDLKHAVDLLSDGKVAEGINVLETNKRIKEIRDSCQRANRIAFDYLSLTPDERKETLIIAGTHQEREAIINSIREGLKAEGSLGKEVKAKRLKSKNLTNVQKKYAHYYEEGNVIIPLANYKRLGLEKGQQYTVKAVEGDSLVLLGKDGQEKRASPAHFKYKEVYEAIETNIAVGDRLRWGKNDKQLNRINGEEFVVTQIDKGIATIQTETGKREQIELKKPQHLDHALVSTTYSSQGVTAKKVIVSITDDLTLSQESFYVAASRAKYNLQLYVENQTRLIKKAQTSRAQLNPLELIKAHRQKEVDTERTTSSHKNEQEELNKTVHKNYDRNQTAEPNPQRDSDRNSRTNPPKIKRDRNQPQHSNRQFGIKPTGIDELANEINRFIEQKETERITESIESLNRSIRNGILSDRGIGRLDRTIKEYARRRKLERIGDSLEKSIIESDPKLIGALEQLTVQLKNSTAIRNLHHSIIKKQIMQNLDKVNQHEREILKLKTEKLTEQLKQLEENPKASKRKRGGRERDSLKKQLASINSYLQLSTGQKVTKDSLIGTITDLKLSPGGMPEAWVQWDNYPVTIPEQPSRLEVIQQKQEHESTRNTQQPQPVNGENIGRRSSLRLETSSRQTRQHRRQIDRGGIQPSPQTSTGISEPTSQTTDQSVKPDSRKTRPTPRKSKPTDIEARPGIVRDVVRVDQSWRSLNRSNQEFGRVQQDFRELADRARNMPLEEVAERLGLEPDRYDSHKYKSDAHIISINDQKFYDHLNQKGGGGAIDLVMYLQQSSFKEAVTWLNGNTINLTPVKQALSFNKQPVERQPFSPPVPDESKWCAVKDYLTNTRGLPESMVDNLHGQDTLYADSKQNAVFVRKNMEGKITGASLRGTYNDSKFKGLAKGTTRDGGWFALKKGQGEIERIVLTESPIDAISAAAISKKKETTLFISTDGSGSLPHEFLQNKLAESKQVIVAYDNDEAGNKMARAVLEKLPGGKRITPTVGKDWNEQLLHSQNLLEQKRQMFRQEYERLKCQVQKNRLFQFSGVEEVDTAVAMLVIKEAVGNGSTDNLINRVGEVLSQSDQLKEWKQSMLEGEYRALAEDYVVKKYKQASYLRENIRAEREQNRDIEHG
ncbi:MAG: AAA family ATPase, partial [Xenococcaceae cyanobacterium]